MNTLVNQDVGKLRNNLKLQNAMTLNDIERKDSSPSVGLQNFIEIQDGHINCCVELTCCGLKI
jgi:hypothetical protein